MEVWKKIEGFENYEVSSYGNVKSLERKVSLRFKHLMIRKEKILKPANDKKGYQMVRLDGKMKKVHRLVALSFIEKIENKDQVNHINGIKTDNRFNNLEWVDNRENQCHRIKNKTSIYTGVSYDKERDKWYCAITINKKRHSLGRFKTEIEAKKEYDLFCLKMNIKNKYDRATNPK